MPKNELLIYPSKEKYDLSRKQPFIAYFDRLKNTCFAANCFLSFQDTHFQINILMILFSTALDKILDCMQLCYASLMNRSN